MKPSDFNYHHYKEQCEEELFSSYFEPGNKSDYTEIPDLKEPLHNPAKKTDSQQNPTSLSDKVVALFNKKPEKELLASKKKDESSTVYSVGYGSE